MTIKNFSYESFYAELKEKLTGLMFDEADVSMVGEAFNNGLRTMFHTADSLVLEILNRQFAEERSAAE